MTENTAENKQPIVSPKFEESYLVFELGRYYRPEMSGWFALPVRRVTQVIEPTSMTPIPLAPVEFLGIIHNHGKIVTVVDPAPILGLGVQGVAVNHIVILRLDEFGSAHMGLQVRRIRGILSRDELEKVDVPVDACIAWAAKAEDSIVHVIDIAPFLDELSNRFNTEEPRAAEQGVMA